MGCCFGRQTGGPTSTTTRARPQVSAGTLRTDTGVIIRAARAAESDSACRNPAMYAACRALGLNAVRVGVLKGTRTMAQVFSSLDQVVEAARNNRMYVMLGNPDALGTPKPGKWANNLATNKANSIAFWEPTADRYRNETHVFYEMLNEPEEWGLWSNYTSSAGVPTALTVALREVFDAMRSAAPNTVLLAPTAANFDASGGMAQYIKAIQAWESLGAVDWSKACWSYHGYNSTARMQVNSKYTATPGDAVTPAPDVGRAALAWMRDRYPIVCTETNWWMEAARSVLIDVLDAHEDVQVAWSLMRHPLQTAASSFSDELFAPGNKPLDHKVDQLRTRGFNIPVE